MTLILTPFTITAAVISGIALVVFLYASRRWLREQVLTIRRKIRRKLFYTPPPKYPPKEPRWVEDN